MPHVRHGIPRETGRSREDRPRLGDRGGLGVARGEADRLRGEERAHAEQLAGEDTHRAVEAAGEDVRRQERGRPLAAEVEHHGAGAATALHDAEAGEVAEGLANRAPSAGERRGEVVLGGEAEARGICARDDAPEDFVRDALHLARGVHRFVRPRRVVPSILFLSDRLV